MRKKKCIRCGRRRTVGMFYAHPGMADGHLNKCKDCCCSDVKENKKLKREKYRKYERERARRPERRSAQLEYQRRYRKENGDKIRAQRKVAYHVRCGNMTAKPCEVCGAVEYIHKHHDDYSKPLDVRWLCPEHHSEAHREI